MHNLECAVCCVLYPLSLHEPCRVGGVSAFLLVLRMLMHAQWSTNGRDLGPGAWGAGERQEAGSPCAMQHGKPVAHCLPGQAAYAQSRARGPCTHGKPVAHSAAPCTHGKLAAHRALSCSGEGGLQKGGAQAQPRLSPPRPGARLCSSPPTCGLCPRLGHGAKAGFKHTQTLRKAPWGGPARRDATRWVAGPRYALEQAAACRMQESKLPSQKTHSEKRQTLWHHRDCQPIDAVGVGPGHTPAGSATRSSGRGNTSRVREQKPTNSWRASLARASKPTGPVPWLPTPAARTCAHEPQDTHS